jgi:hypothetical protein
MNYFDLYSSYPDRTITAAWDSQVKEADKTPWLTDTLTKCGGELFARFAAYYAELRMRLAALAIALTMLAAASAAETSTGRESTLHVNCDEAPVGGDGSPRFPLPTITAALNVARGLPTPVTISIAKGVCDDEILPLRLDFSVSVKGARKAVSRGGRPDGTQTADTLLMEPIPGPNTTFFIITAEDVTIAHLSIDGGLLLGPDGPRPTNRMPLGVLADRADNFALNHLRIIGTGQAIRSEGSSGLISSNYLSGDSGMFLSGGAANDPPSVVVTNNTIVYRVNGVTMAAVTEVGTFLRATVTDNDIVTSFMNSGPTNPAAFRVNPLLTDAVNTAGTVEVVAEGNLFGGSAKYGIMIHGSAMMTRRTDGQSYTGDVTAEFSNNVIDSAVVFPALLTFTNARATVFPCEINPTITVGCQQPGSGKWEYLTNALFDLRHSGELTGALIDHPEFHPFDGYALGNTLVINRETVDYQTFVVVPQ